MWGLSLDCGIKSVRVKTVNLKQEKRTVRRCRVILTHEFTEAIARSLGGDAVKVRDTLKSGAAEKAVLRINRIAAIGALTARDGSAVEVKHMIGVKATALACKPDDDEPPTVELAFDFDWQEDAWVFFGRYCDLIASVVLTKSQLALAHTDHTPN